MTEQPLPRTRLGKYQRFPLPALYAEALAGASWPVPVATSDLFGIPVALGGGLRGRVRHEAEIGVALQLGEARRPAGLDRQPALG